MKLPLAFTQLTKRQEMDENWVNIINSMNKEENNLCYFIKNDTLMYRNSKGKSKMYLPERLFSLGITFYHNTIFGGRFSILRTTSRIEECFFHPKLKEFVKQKVKSCKIYMMSKNTQSKFEGKMISIPVEKVMDTLYIDILGP